MTGYIKYFENGGKNMYFVIKDDDVLDKYNEIWNKIKNTLNIKCLPACLFMMKNAVVFLLITKCKSTICLKIFKCIYTLDVYLTVRISLAKHSEIFNWASRIIPRNI